VQAAVPRVFRSSRAIWSVITSTVRAGQGSRPARFRRHRHRGSCKKPGLDVRPGPGRVSAAWWWPSPDTGPSSRVSNPVRRAGTVQTGEPAIPCSFIVRPCDIVVSCSISC